MNSSSSYRVSNSYTHPSGQRILSLILESIPLCVFVAFPAHHASFCLENQSRSVWTGELSLNFTFECEYPIIYARGKAIFMFWTFSVGTLTIRFILLEQMPCFILEL